MYVFVRSVACRYVIDELALCKVEALFEDFCCLSSIVTTHSMQHIEVYLNTIKLKQTESADSMCSLSTRLSLALHSQCTC